MAGAPFRKHRLVSCAIGAAAVLAALGLAFTAPAQAVELKTIDLRFAIRGPIEASEDIVHIDIDDRSLGGLGRWPWDRNIHAVLIQGLRDMGASAVVFDVEFLEPQGGGADEKLRDQMASAGMVYLPMGFTSEEPRVTPPHIERSSSAEAPKESPLPRFERMILPVAPLTEEGAVRRFGSVDLPEADPDGIYRRVPAVFLQEGRMYLNLGALVGLDRLGIELSKVELRNGILRAGDKLAIPLDSKGRVTVNWVRTGEKSYDESFKHLSYEEVYRVAHRFVTEGSVDSRSDFPRIQKIVEGRICFIGSTARGAQDNRPGPNTPILPGVAVHSNIANMTLTNAFIHDVPGWTAILLALAVGGSSAAVCALGRPWLAAGAVAGLCILWLSAAVYLFNSGILVPASPPVLAAVAVPLAVLPYRLATEERMKGRVLQTFERFLDRNIIDEILDNPDLLREDARRIKATVIFTDIEGFSTWAERTPPEVTVKVLNVYLTLVTESIISFQGYLDKYLGDGTMAIFGLKPDLDPRLAAENACRTAMEIQKKTREQKHLFPFGRTRIGIASGDIVAGFIGGVSGSLDFTAVGDVVNLSARLQEQNKETGTSTLMDEATRALVQGTFEPKFVATAKIRGREGEVKVYTLDPLVEGK